MATNDEKAPATEPAAATAADDAASPVAQTVPHRGLGGLALAGIIGGGVVAAAILFGAGLAVGVALPDRAPMGITQVGHPGGPGANQAFPDRQDGQRPPAPFDDRDGDRDKPGDTDAD